MLAQIFPSLFDRHPILGAELPSKHWLAPGMPGRFHQHNGRSYCECGRRVRKATVEWGHFRIMVDMKDGRVSVPREPVYLTKEVKYCPRCFWNPTDSGSVRRVICDSLA